MQRIFISLFLILHLCIVTKSQSSGQVVICDNHKSSHPIDIRALQLRDSLQLKGIDTIVIYRHWIYTNGYNGYGKIIWLDQGHCYQSKIELENRDGLYYFQQENTRKLNSDSLITFFINNHMDKLTENPTYEALRLSEDASHFVEFNLNKIKYCFIISGVLVRSNQQNIRAKYVNMLADEPICIFTIDGIIRDTMTIKK